MKRSGLMFLLLSGCVLVCHLQPDILIRHFHFVGLMKNWTEAQQYCREEFTDLATILDPNQNTVAQHAAMMGEIWIGLFRSNWRWSLDHEEFSMETSYSRWAMHEPMLTCVAITESGVWFTQHCGSMFYVMCYSAEYNKHILVTKNMTWSDGQAYCRSRYTDLSSIRNQEDNQQILSLMQNYTDSLTSRESSQDGGQDGGQDGDQDSRQDGGQDGGQDSSQDSGQDSVENRVEINKKDINDGGGGGTNRNTHQLTMWIGLHKSFWMWSNWNEVSFTRWAADQSDDVFADCVKMDSTANWFHAVCSEKHFFLCHSDHRPSVVRTVKVRLSGGSADLNDPTLQSSILQQLKQRLEEAGIREEVKLRWRTQPDGKVFHREEEEEEEEKAPPAGQEEETVCEHLVWKPGMK